MDVRISVRGGPQLTWILATITQSHSELGSHPDSGFKFKALGVVWENHKVVGAGGMRLNIRVFPDAFKELLFKPIMPILMKMEKFAPKPKTILHNFNGIIAPGEMCLVLGRPGSGCSTFLKTIANEREGYLSIDGRVEYEGIEATEFRKVYEGEALYNPEDGASSKPERGRVYLS